MEKPLIALTGASGFIGQHLCELLLKKNENLRAFVRKASKSYEIGCGDLAEFNEWDRVLAGVHTLIHLAGKAHDLDEKNFEEYNLQNTEVTKKMAVAAKKNGVRQFIFLSTIKVNGPYTRETPFDSKTPLTPIGDYAVSKWAAEVELMKLHQPGVFDVVIIRPTLIYGPGVKANLMNLIRLVQKRIPLPFGAIDNKRSLLYVKNLTDLIYLCLSNPKASGQIFLASDPDVLSLTKMIHLIAKGLGVKTFLLPVPKKLMIFFTDVLRLKSLKDRLFSNLHVDTRQTKNILGWTPPYTSEAGFQDMFRTLCFLHKPKIVRVVTSSEAVYFHLRNILKFDNLQTENFETIVVGNQVSKYQNLFPHIRFKDIQIERDIHLLSDLKAVFLLYKFLKKEKPSLVHSVMPKAGLVSALSSFIACVPIRLHTFTGQKWLSASGPKRHLLRFFDQLVVWLNTVCFTDSFSQSQFLFTNSIAFKNKPLPVIGQGSLSGVDLEKFNKNAIAPDRKTLRETYGLGDQQLAFIFLGRKCADKGLFELIRAFSKLEKEIPQIRLLLVGPDESSGLLETTLKAFSNQKIINLPSTQQPEIYLNAADIFCIPSYREGFGSVVIEAAALQLPSIGTKISGLMDSIIDGQTGLLIKLKDEDELYLAMKQIATNVELRQKLAAAAYRNAIEKYDSKFVYAELIKNYKKLNLSLP